MKRACRVCGGTQYKPFAVKNGFHLERCVQCTLVQVTDDLSRVSLKDLYDPDFFEETYRWQQEAKGQRIAQDKFHQRLSEIEVFRRQGRILDIGCGFGFFLEVARSRGWDAIGVEIGDYAASYARDKLGLTIYGDMRSPHLNRESFDVITMWDVIEHLDDPVADLRHVRDLMTGGGLLVFNTPDVDSYLRKLQGTYWRCFIPPIHVTNFNTRSASLLLERAAFRLLRQTVALPREALLQKLGVFDLLRKLRFSDKLVMFAEKT